MQWTIQLGDLATRLARGFGVTGKVSTSLNDPVLPVALVQDVTRVPFADDPQRFAVDQGVSGNVSTFAFLGFFFHAPRTQLLAASCTPRAAATVPISFHIVRKITGLTGANQLSGACCGLNTATNIAQATVHTGVDASVIGPILTDQVAFAAQYASSIYTDLSRFVRNAVLFQGDGFYFNLPKQAITFDLVLHFAEYSR